MLPSAFSKIGRQRAEDTLTAYIITTATINLWAAIGVLAEIGLDVPAAGLGDGVAAQAVQILLALPVLLWQLGTPTPIIVVAVTPGVIALAVWVAHSFPAPRLAPVGEGEQ